MKSTKPDESNLKRFSWYVKPFFWNQKRKYGTVLEPALLWGKIPKVFVPMATLYGALDRKSSPLNPQLRSMITVRVSQINWCSFCVDINSATLLKRGADQKKLEYLTNWQESSLFSKTEKLALEYTEAITFSDRQVSPELLQRTKDHFGETATIELTALIAFQNLSSKFNSALGVQPQGFCFKNGKKEDSA